MNDRVSKFVARLLAHPAGFFVFNAFTLAWFAIPVAVGWSLGGTKGALVALLLAGYLDIVTWFSSATQFTIAYQNEQTAAKLDETLTALLQLARNDETDNVVLIAQTEALAVALNEIKALHSDLQASRA